MNKIRMISALVFFGLGVWNGVDFITDLLKGHETFAVVDGLMAFLAFKWSMEQ